MSRDAAVADGVHAAMDAMQPTEGDAVVDRPAAEPERQQLTPGYHSVLASRYHCDRPFPPT
jgi:hypothetical protein